jgi:hypothetical protein
LHLTSKPRLGVNYLINIIVSWDYITLVVDSEKDALEIALKTIWNLPETEPRIILIKNTLKLNEIYVSKNVWEDVKDRSSISALNGWKTLSFDEGGKLMLRI